MTAAGRAAGRPSERDLSILRLVQKLNYVTSAHVWQLIFAHTNLSRTPCNEALKRLTRLRYLDRVEKRPLGGTKGGSSFYVYRLGRRGFFTLVDPTDPNPEPFKARRQAPEHSLAVADVMVILRQQERLGLVINAVQTEPDCWVKVGGAELKPDLFLDIIHPRAGRLMLFPEMDMATQGDNRLKSKFELYSKAAKHATDEQLLPWGGVLPRPLFIGKDIERKRELEYLIRRLPPDDRGLFRVTTREELPFILWN